MVLGFVLFDAIHQGSRGSLGLTVSMFRLQEHTTKTQNSHTPKLETRCLASLVLFVLLTWVGGARALSFASAKKQRGPTHVVWVHLFFLPSA